MRNFFGLGSYAQDLSSPRTKAAGDAAKRGGTSPLSRDRVVNVGQAARSAAANVLSPSSASSALPVGLSAKSAGAGIDGDGGFAHAPGDNGEAHWRDLREALLLQSRLLRRSADRRLQAYLDRRSANGQSGHARSALELLEEELSRMDSPFLLRRGSIDNSGQFGPSHAAAAPDQEEMAVARSDLELALSTQRRAAQELNDAVLMLKDKASEADALNSAWMAALLRGCIDGLATGVGGDAWADAEVAFLMEVGYAVACSDLRAPEDPAAHALGSSNGASPLVDEGGKRLAELDAKLDVLRPRLATADSGASGGADDGKEAKPTHSALSTAPSTSATSCGVARQGTGSSNSSQPVRSPTQPRTASGGGSGEVASPSRWLLPARPSPRKQSNLSTGGGGSVSADSATVTSVVSAVEPPLAVQLQELVRDLAQQHDELRQELSTMEAAAESGAAPSSANAAEAQRLKTDAGALAARGDSLRAEVKRLRSERRTAYLQLNKLRSRLLELREESVFERVTEERLEAALAGAAPFIGPAASAGVSATPALAASEEELRQELADTYERLAAKGLLVQELHELRQRHRSLEEEVERASSAQAAGPTTGAGTARGDRLFYNVLQDGRQIELTSKVQQQGNEIIELRERLRQLHEQQQASRGSVHASASAGP